MRVVEAPIVHTTRGTAAVPRVALRSWDCVTPLGDDVATAWSALLDGTHLTDHAGCRSHAHAIDLARAVAARAVAGGIDPGAALVVGTSKGSVENWLDPAGDVC